MPRAESFAAFAIFAVDRSGFAGFAVDRRPVRRAGACDLGAGARTGQEPVAQEERFGAEAAEPKRPGCPDGGVVERRRADGVARRRQPSRSGRGVCRRLGDALERKRVERSQRANRRCSARSDAARSALGKRPARCRQRRSDRAGRRDRHVLLQREGRRARSGFSVEGGGVADR